MISRRVVLRSAWLVPASTVIGCTPAPREQSVQASTDPDVGIAERLAEHLAHARDVSHAAEATGQSALASAFARLHEAHLSEWPVAVPAAAAASAKGWKNVERQLRVALREAVTSLTDPGFARRVASMTAASAQLLTDPAPLVDEPVTGAQSAALVALLGVEREAVWRWGWLAGQERTPAALRRLCLEELWEHRQRRDQVEASVQALGGEVPAAEVAYDVSLPTTPDAAWSAATSTQQRVLAGYAELVAASTGQWRAWATMWLENAAIRDLAFRGTPGMFPGER